MRIAGLISIIVLVDAADIKSVEAQCFGNSERNSFGLDILPEYGLERHVVFPAFIEETRRSDEETERSVLYRITCGPKTPREEGKPSVLIQSGVLCESDFCVANKPAMATAYILVDQGYDTWLESIDLNATENTISSEDEARNRLKHIAEYILVTTGHGELPVMGYLNGETKIFAMKRERADKKPGILHWFDDVPGVRTLKRWYRKGKSYISNSYDRVVESLDFLGEKVDVVIDDSIVRAFKERVLRAWGIATDMVLPTLTVKDLSKFTNDPDARLDTAQLITKYGYVSETHNVQTEDGYLLTVHRMLGSRESSNERKTNKSVVLLQHGVLASSSDWVMLGPSNSLAYHLSDSGFDVWMGNSRGNTYSRAHVNLTSRNPEFWDFSWHEMGVYDLPAVIDYILAATGQSSLSYVGHSQGATEVLVLLSERPEYNEKIAKFVGYAPVAYLRHTRSPIIDVFARLSDPIYYLFRLLNVNEFLPTNALLTNLGRDACEARTPIQVVCTNSLFLITGYDMAQLNTSMLPIILGHVPAGGSTKQLVHYGQLYNSKTFRQFNYVLPLGNERKYGQHNPPAYDVRNVRVPTALFYASNDLLSDYRDVEQLAEDLPNVERLVKVRSSHFNHVDFIFAINVSNLIYEPTIEYLTEDLQKGERRSRRHSSSYQMLYV